MTRPPSTPSSPHMCVRTTFVKHRYLLSPRQASWSSPHNFFPLNHWSQYRWSNWKWYIQEPHTLLWRIQYAKWNVVHLCIISWYLTGDDDYMIVSEKLSFDALLSNRWYKLLHFTLLCLQIYVVWISRASDGSFSVANNARQVTLKRANNQFSHIKIFLSLTAKSHYRENLARFFIS